MLAFQFAGDLSDDYRRFVPLSQNPESCEDLMDAETQSLLDDVDSIITFLDVQQLRADSPASPPR